MAPRSRHRRVDHGSSLVDLDDVFADDRLIDAIAQTAIVQTAIVQTAIAQPAIAKPAIPRCGTARTAVVHPIGAAGTAGAGRADRSGRHRRLGVATADPLMELFQSWRDELVAVPLPAPPYVHRVRSVVLPENAAAGRRSLRPALAVAAAIAALLVGSATVGSRQASPDGALWAVTEVVWPHYAESVTSRHNVEDALRQAMTALADGRSQQAQLALLRAAVELGKVDDVDGRFDMQARVDQLWRTAAPQGLSSTSPGPELLAGGSEAALASAVSTPARDPGARPSKPSSASASTSVSKSKQGSSTPLAVPARPPVESSPSPALPGLAAGAAPSVADPIPPAGNKVAVPQPSAPVAAPSIAVDPAALAVAPPTEQSAPVLPTTAPAGTPTPSPPPVDPLSAPAMMPPPPGAADQVSLTASTDPTPSAAPPAPAPAPTSTETAPDQTGPATSGSTVGVATGTQNPANTATGTQNPANTATADIVTVEPAAAGAATATPPPIG